MNRRLLFLTFVGALLCGCGSNQTSPTIATQNTNDAPTKSAPAQLPDDPSPTIASNQRLADNVVRDDQQQYIRFPAAGLKMVRPDGFDDAESFHGFQQPSTQSSVMAVMIPGPYAETSRGFTAKQLKTRGMTLESKEDVEVDGQPGVLLSVTQNAYGTEFAKWILAFGNDTESKLVTANFPNSEESNLSAKLKAVVLSTKIDDTPVPAPGSDVGFVIDTPAKLKATRGIGKMLMYTKDGVIPTKSPEDPLFIAAPSLSKVSVGDQRQFALQRLFQTAHTKIGSVISNDTITIDGLDGYEIIADAEDVDSGTPVKVFQAVLYDDGSYILMQGLVGANVANQYLPEFKAMARSLTRNP